MALPKPAAPHPGPSTESLKDLPAQPVNDAEAKGVKGGIDVNPNDGCELARNDLIDRVSSQH